MKGTEKIIAHIRSDAEAKAAAILAQAEQQCAVIREDYDKQAKAVYADKVRSGVKECEDRVDSMGRIAQMEAKKSILALKQEMVSEGFVRARQMIVELPEEQYVALLAKLAANASVTGDEEIVLNERDKARLGDKVAGAANRALGNGKLSTADETGDFEGGLVLRRGNIEVNCTVELLVELCRDEMSAELASVLFA